MLKRGDVVELKRYKKLSRQYPYLPKTGKVRKVLSNTLVKVDLEGYEFMDMYFNPKNLKLVKPPQTN